MNGLWYLFAAYTIIWVGVLLYVFRLVGKNRELERKLKVLESEIRKK